MTADEELTNALKREAVQAGWTLHNRHLPTYFTGERDSDHIAVRVIDGAIDMSMVKVRRGVDPLTAISTIQEERNVE
jgi:urease accessory protein UreE